MRVVKCLLFVLIEFISLNILAQTFKGRIIDENSKPIPYANVMLINKTDSSFISGTTTNGNGQFSILSSKSEKQRLLKISYVGYETKYAAANDSDYLTIRLGSMTNSLKEIVVKGHRPTFEMKSGVLITNVQNTILEKLGNANDVFAQLPFITEIGGKVSVFGRGTPSIYVNNRLIQDDNELTQIHSEQIKDIQIIMNPGSEYGAETNAVIKITTLRPIGEGFSMNLTIQGKQKHKYEHNELLDMNYHKGGLDLFGLIYYNRNKWNQKQSDEQSFQYNSNAINLNENGRIGYQNKSIKVSSGAYYIFSKKHSAGIKYEYTKRFKTPAYSSFQDNGIENDTTFSFKTNSDIKQEGKQHYVNTYYQGRFDNLSLNGDATYLYKSSGENKTVQDTRNTNESTVISLSHRESDLLAARLWGDLPIWNGNLNFRIEDTYTNNRQKYVMENESVAKELPSNTNKSIQIAEATYLSYSKNWQRFSLDMGLRYEHIKYNYYLNDIKQEVESRMYDNFFPSFSLSYHKDKLSMNLMYRTLTQRPSYRELRSSISYNNSYNYEGGNPSLQSAIIHQVGYILTYGDLQLNSRFRYIKNDAALTVGHFENKPVIIFTFNNLNVKNYSTDLSYSPKIFFWHPILSLGIVAQDLHYNNRSYNKPIFSYSWKNAVQLPSNTVVTFNLYGESYGNSSIDKQHCFFYTETSIKKNFGERLEISLGAEDLFNTYRERYAKDVEDIHYEKWNNTDLRNIYLKLTFKLNKSQNKYKGGVSGTDEMKRL